MFGEIPLDIDLLAVTEPQQLLDAVTGIRLDVNVSSAGMLIRHEGLLFKLRGALGSVLGASESMLNAKQVDAQFSPEQLKAAILLFGTKPRILVEGISQEVAKPFALRASRQGQELVLSLLLFGRAARNHVPVGEALLEAICGRLDWRALARQIGVPGLAIKPAGLSVKATALVVPSDDIPPARVNLHFLTGIEMNSGAATAQINSTMVFEKLVARAALLAPWFGVSECFNRAQLRRVFAGLNVSVDVDAELSIKQRRSSRSGDSWQSEALRADVYLEGDLTAVWPLLRFGALVHLGRSAVTGLGRYSLVKEP